MQYRYFVEFRHGIWTFSSFSYSITVLQYWVPPKINVPLSENLGHPVILHPSPNRPAPALGTIFFEEVQY